MEVSVKATKKIISAILAGVMLFALVFPLAGCADEVTTLLEITPTEEESRVVGKIGKYDIYYDELRYITLMYKEQLEGKYGKDVFKNEATAKEHEAELRELVYGSITANYAVLTLAEQNGITIDDPYVRDYRNLKMEEIASDIRALLIAMNAAKNEENSESETKEESETAAETEAEGSKEYIPSYDEINAEYKKQIKSNYLTDRYVRFLYSIDACVQKLVIKYEEDGKLLTEEAEIIAYIKANFCRTLHVFVRNDIGENVEENRGIANTVFEELNAGRPFNSAVGSKYNDDLMTTTVNGHYFGKGEMDPAYESAAFALEIGKYSGVVEGENGFYIIKRLPLEDKYINQNYEVLRDQYRYAAVNSDVSLVRETLSFAASEVGESIALWSIK